MTTTDPTGGPAIYVASRASVPDLPEMWKRARAEGAPIISSWIDEAGPGQTLDVGGFWEAQVFDEIRACTGLVLYVRDGDAPLKGAIGEACAALILGKPVVIVAEDCDSRAVLGSWIAHRLVMRRNTIREAFQALGWKGGGHD